jgi:hemoglobin-like flavoprotein
VTGAAVQRVQEHFETIRLRGLGAQFYATLFSRHPSVRQLFPADVTTLSQHFIATLELAISHLGHVTAVDQQLRELGARHLHYGAQPQHYELVRDVLVATIGNSAGDDWNAELARDWRQAINMIIVPMLRGAAVETAAIAQRIAAEDAVAGV